MDKNENSRELNLFLLGIYLSLLHSKLNFKRFQTFSTHRNEIVPLKLFFILQL